MICLKHSRETALGTPLVTASMTALIMALIMNLITALIMVCRRVDFTTINYRRGPNAACRADECIELGFTIESIVDLKHELRNSTDARFNHQPAPQVRCRGAQP